MKNSQVGLIGFSVPSLSNHVMLPFILATDLPIQAGTKLQPDLPLEKPPQNVPMILKDEQSIDIPLGGDLLQDSFPQQVPLDLDGPVESFDPIARAIAISKSFPRRLCGTYHSFDQNASFDVKLTFSEVIPKGQIISLKGNLKIDKYMMPVQGSLNAKSEQFELLIVSRQTPLVLGSAGSFSGLQGINLLGWNSSQFTNKGGRLSLGKICNLEKSESPMILSLWK